MAKRKVFQISHSLSEGIEETISAAQRYSGALNVEIIPIKRIDLDPDNPRELHLDLNDLLNGIVSDDPLLSIKQIEKKSLESIAASINDQGIINPIIVYRFEDRYRLVAGERRTLASIIAGKEDIQAKILEHKPSPLKLALLQWAENIERQDLSLWERLKNLEKILEASARDLKKNSADISATEIASLLGCSLPLASHYKAVLFGPETLLDAIHANRIKNLDKAAFIASQNEDELVASLIEQCVKGATLKVLKLYVQQFKSSKKKLTYSVTKTSLRANTMLPLGTTTNAKVLLKILEYFTQDEQYSVFLPAYDDMSSLQPHELSKLFVNFIKTLEIQV